ncbi:MAG: polysaccharide deacetylase family protein [Bacteroidota bacterium]|nr:polysaccharide deacetylase family protein [Bacteroidota bacterium]
MKVITTSWDDGHVLDFRLADLLYKYNLPGTFYIPKHNAEHEVMLSEQVAELAKGFEIGGHTINHIRLHSKEKAVLQNEIRGCYNWLSDLLGYAPQPFCFPGGVFHQKAVDVVFQTGFKIARTTELLSTKLFTNHNLTPTTLQVFEHNAVTYAKHLIKRQRWANLLQWLGNHSLHQLPALTESYLNRINKNGGCFHLWGHSWEIEEFGLWEKLEELFRIISGRTDFVYVSNSGLISHQQILIQQESAFL